jgi:hypothetical protein
MDNPEKLAAYIYRAHMTKTNKPKTQRSMCWTTLGANKNNNVNNT